MKKIIVGGEKFPKWLLEKLRQHTDAHIFNAYGPTETTIWATVSNLTNAEQVTIGKPFYNTRIFLLDENNHLVTKENCYGQLCVAGKDCTLNESIFV